MGFILMRPHRILKSICIACYTLSIVITIISNGYDGLMQTWLRCFKVEITYTLIKFSFPNNVHIQIECEKDCRLTRQNRFESTVLVSCPFRASPSSSFFPKWICMSLWAKNFHHASVQLHLHIRLLRLHHHYHQNWCKTFWCAAYHELDQLVSLSFRKMEEKKCP